MVERLHCWHKGMCSAAMNHQRRSNAILHRLALQCSSTRKSVAARNVRPMRRLTTPNTHAVAARSQKPQQMFTCCNRHQRRTQCTFTLQGHTCSYGYEDKRDSAAGAHLTGCAGEHQCLLGPAAAAVAAIAAGLVRR